MNCYFEGNGVKKNYKQAASLFEQAANGGHVTSQYNIGICYKDGYGVLKNKTKAKKWLQLALKNGYSAAKEELKGL